MGIAACDPRPTSCHVVARRLHDGSCGGAILAPPPPQQRVQLVAFGSARDDLRSVGAVVAEGACDGEPVCRAVAERQSDLPVVVVIPPRATAVPSPAADTSPSERDRHIELVQNKRRMGWQRAVGYGRR